MNLTSDQISCVIQGPVSSLTHECVASIRKFLPQATVIVSTYDKDKVKNLDYDELALHEDVGAKYPCLLDKNSKANNTNRHIASTMAGLLKVKTKYTLKIRSDFSIEGNGFLEFFDKYKIFNSEQRFFEKRILICTLFSKLPRKSTFAKLRGTGFPYHPSDFVHFGLTSDLIKLWNIDLVSEEDLDWFSNKMILKKEEPFRHRYTAEQQLFVQFMRKNKIEFFANDFCDRSEKNAAHTDLIMANNFVMMSFKNFCIKPSKEMFMIKFQPYYSVSYTTKNWLDLYKKYCDNTIQTPLIDIEFLQALYYNWPMIFGVQASYDSFHRHFRRLIKPFGYILKWIRSAALAPIYLVKLLIKVSPRLINAILSSVKIKRR